MVDLDFFGHKKSPAVTLGLWCWAQMVGTDLRHSGISRNLLFRIRGLQTPSASTSGSNFQATAGFIRDFRLLSGATFNNQRSSLRIHLHIGNYTDPCRLMMVGMMSSLSHFRDSPSCSLGCLTISADPAESLIPEMTISLRMTSPPSVRTNIVLAVKVQTSVSKNPTIGPGFFVVNPLCAQE
ncbi:hypothetical protein [Pseudomonas syringae]|uniref:hypothetical protein n=1 Tax=Pseudomonas syringae TaxID=317 RepID=UPI001267CB3D|nr:hypothetical protein [Pseudomonas syringae]